MQSKAFGGRHSRVRMFHVAGNMDIQYDALRMFDTVPTRRDLRLFSMVCASKSADKPRLTAFFYFSMALDETVTKLSARAKQDITHLTNLRRAQKRSCWRPAAAEIGQPLVLGLLGSFCSLEPLISLLFNQAYFILYLFECQSSNNGLVNTLWHRENANFALSVVSILLLQTTILACDIKSGLRKI